MMPLNRSGNVTPWQGARQPEGTVTPRQPLLDPGSWIIDAGSGMKERQAMQPKPGQGLHDQMLLRRVAELERIVCAQQEDMVAFRKQQFDSLQAIQEDLNAQLGNLQAHVQGVGLEIKDAKQIMEAEIQHLRSELRDSDVLTSSGHGGEGGLRISVIDKKFADMGSIQAELVQLAERCDIETTKLAQIVEQMVSKIASVQTCAAQQVVAYTSLHARVAACEVLSNPRDSMNVRVMGRSRSKAALHTAPLLCAAAGTCHDMAHEQAQGGASQMEALGRTALL